MVGHHFDSVGSRLLGNHGDHLPALQGSRKADLAKFLSVRAEEHHLNIDTLLFHRDPQVLIRLEMKQICVSVSPTQRFFDWDTRLQITPTSLVTC